jgi:hypothetical protein
LVAVVSSVAKRELQQRPAARPEHVGRVLRRRAVPLLLDRQDLLLVRGRNWRA